MLRSNLICLLLPLVSCAAQTVANPRNDAGRDGGSDATAMRDTNGALEGGLGRDAAALDTSTGRDLGARNDAALEGGTLSPVCRESTQRAFEDSHWSLNPVGANPASTTVAVAGTCPDVNTTSSELGYGVFRGTTIGATDDNSVGSRDTAVFAGACRGGRTDGDVGYRWRAPRAGTYLFFAEADYTQRLTVVRGTSCEGRDFRCKQSTNARNNMFLSWPDVAVTMELQANEDVVVIVDGNGGYSSHFSRAGNYVVSILPFDHDASRFDNTEHAALMSCAAGAACACTNGRFFNYGFGICSLAGVEQETASQCLQSVYTNTAYNNAVLSCRGAATRKYVGCLAAAQETCSNVCTLQYSAYLSKCPDSLGDEEPGYITPDNVGSIGAQSYSERVRACATSCPEYTTTSMTVSGEISATRGSDQARCGGGQASGNDVTVVWTPPTNAPFWVAYATSSEFQANVLQNGWGICGRTSSGNNFTGCDPTAPLIAWRNQQDPIYFEVDAAAPGTGGRFDLHIEEYACSDLAPVTPAAQTGLRLSGTVASGTGPFRRCNGAGKQTLTRWSPPQAGTYLVSTRASAVPVVLQQMRDCSNVTSTSCSTGTTGMHQLVLPLSSAEPVLFSVQNLTEQGGNFTLDFSTAFSCASVASTLQGTAVTGSTRASTTYFRGTCQTDRDQVNYLWQPTRSGPIRIAANTTQAASAPGVSVLVLEVSDTANCGAFVQRACDDGWREAGGGNMIRGASATTTTSVVAGRSYIIAVGTQTAGDSYALNLSWL